MREPTSRGPGRRDSHTAEETANRRPPAHQPVQSEPAGRAEQGRAEPIRIVIDASDEEDSQEPIDVDASDDEGSVGSVGRFILASVFISVSN